MEVDSVCVFAQPPMYNIFVPTKKQVVSIGLFSFKIFCFSTMEKKSRVKAFY